jgi:hypothetical protein
MNRIKIAYINFIDELLLSGMDKEAQEFVEDIIPGNPTQIYKKEDLSLKNPQTKNVLVPNKSTPTQEKVVEPSFSGKPGGVAPILELGKILDAIKKDPVYINLPKSIKKGLLKIDKMTENAFKYASEKEAVQTTLQKLKKVLDSFGRSHVDLTPSVVKKLTSLQNLVDKEISRSIPARTKKDKGISLPRGIRQRSKAQKEDVMKMRERAQKGLEDIDVPQEKANPEKNTPPLSEKKSPQEGPKTVFETEPTNYNFGRSVEELKNKLLNHPSYSNIFYRLPAPIIKELNKIGLGLDSLKEENISKSASHVNTVLNIYFKKDNIKPENTSMSKSSLLNDYAIKIAKTHLKQNPELYSKIKESMDFSGINNLITPKNKLNDREIARTIRLAISAEHDATHLYELIADSTNNKNVKKVLQDIADEEKVHVGELQELLKKFDRDDEKFLEKGQKEVEDLI